MNELSPGIHELRVVVVDDREPNVALLRRVLESWGFHNVVGIHQSRAVVPHCQQEPPDLLLLDLHMPDPDGFGILEALQDQIRGPVSLPVLVLTGSEIPGAKQRALDAGARDFLTKPFDLDEVHARVRNNLELRMLQIGQRRHERDLEERVKERTAQLEEARLEIVRRLARAGEFRDDETGEHTQRVGQTSWLIAEALCPATDFARAVKVAAPLHDIGKIAVPDAILLKVGKLTTRELPVMQAHTVRGAELLANSSSSLLDMARTIALTHHERWDARGYPNGLSEDGIPFAGRIVAIADVFDALTHERPYKDAWTVDAAVAEITAEASGHFDPQVVEAFLGLDHATLV